MGEGRVEASRPLRVVVDVDADLVDQPAGQHLTWLLVTLLVRSTRTVIETIAVRAVDAPLLAGVDPAEPDGGPSYLASLKAAAQAFGPESALVVDACSLDDVDLILRVGETRQDDRPGAEVLYVSAAGWTGSVSPAASDLPPFDATNQNPFGPYVAACLAAGQTFMYARVHDHRLQMAVLNAWTLAQSTTDLAAVAAVDPGEPAVELDHVLAGVGAVGSALLQIMWAYRPAAGTIRAADADSKGIDNTNLNRCVPFWWSDIGNPKATVAAERLSGHHGLVVDPTVGNAENLVDRDSHLISAVDTPEARQALQDKYPASAVQASTAGLRVEALRVDPTAGTACLRCFNPPRTKASDAEIRASVADMDSDTIATHADAIGTDPEQVRKWGRVGGCGQVGDALLHLLRPSDNSAAQFSVGFMSVLAGVLLAAQVIKDAVRRAGVPVGIIDGVPLVGPNARFVANLLEPANALAGVRRYGRDKACPACRGVRAKIWTKRWTG